MASYSSYWLYQKFEKRGDQDWIPSYPNTYSIDGDETMPLVIRVERDVDCGYVCDEMERWIDIPISDSYICDDCEVGFEVRYTPLSAYTYFGDYMYEIYKSEYRYEISAGTWTSWYENGNIYKNPQRVDKKVVGITEQGDILDASCGDDNGTYSSEIKWEEEYIARNTIQHTFYPQYDDDNHTHFCNGSLTNKILNPINFVDVTIGSCVTTIGGDAFYECATLSSVTIPNSVTTIDGFAFYGCSGLTSVAIPDSVTSIGNSAFEGCRSLRNVTIGSGITSISKEVFSGCTSLESVIFKATTPPQLSTYNVFRDTNNCPIYVPCESVDAYKNASIGWRDYADRIYCDKTIDYRWTPSGYTCIGYDKWELSVKEVTYDSGTTWSAVTPTETAATLIETNSEYCGYIEPFDGKFKANYTDGRVYKLDCNSSSALTETETKPRGYQYSAMTSAVIGDCVTSLERKIFSGCTSLSSITISNSVTSIGYEVFAGCSGLSNVEIGSGVTSIGDYAFAYCSSLSSITIPNSVTEIGYASFQGCYGLTSVTIPSSVTEISSFAFYGCSGLGSITVNATTPPALGTNYTFAETNNCPIYVPYESLDAYYTAKGWRALSTRIVANPNS